MEALTLLEAIGRGLISIPKSLLDGVKRTEQGLEYWDTEQEVKIGGQNERMLAALNEIKTYGIKGVKSPLFKAVRIILIRYYETLPDSSKKKIWEKISGSGTFIATRVTGNYLLATRVANRILGQVAANAIAKEFIGFIVRSEFTLLSVQGLLYEAGAASDRLQQQFPLIYSKMRKENLDMLYFIIEKPMKKYLQAIRSYKLHPHQYKQMAARKIA